MTLRRVTCPSPWCETQQSRHAERMPALIIQTAPLALPLKGRGKEAPFDKLDEWIPLTLPSLQGRGLNKARARERAE